MESQDDSYETEKLKDFVSAYNIHIASKKQDVEEGIQFTLCPNCGYDKAIKEQATKRAIDEESTTVIVCNSCKSTT